MTFKIVVQASMLQSSERLAGLSVCDDYSGYKARFKSGQVIEVGCISSFWYK
jgi:hypothetical protein